MKNLFKFAAALLALLPLAPAQESKVHQEGGNWANEVSGTLAAARNLHVKVDMGAVRIEGGSQPNITYVFHNRARSGSEDRARREFEAYKVNAYVRGDTAWIVAEWQGGNPHRFSGDVVVDVPQNIESVKVSTGGGGITASHIEGRLEAESGGGAIRVEDIRGSVRARTGGDAIEANSIGGDMDAQTGGGKISLTAMKGRVSASTGGGEILLASSQQGATLESGGGNIQVRQCGGALKVSTGGGTIEIGDVSGSAEVQTGGGGIRVGPTKGFVHASTGAGRIELNGVPAVQAETGAGGIVATIVSGGGERTDSRLETGAGDITVYLAPNVSITVRAMIEMANGHKIYSDFPELKITSEGDWGAQTVAAEGSLNGGGPLLKVHTATGNVWFRRASR